VPGSGKTTLAKARAAGCRRVVFFDPAGDYDDQGEVITPGEVAAELRHRFARLVVAPDPESDLAEVFDQLVADCRAAGAEFGPLVLVADEVGDYSRGAEATLTRLHRNGHHDGVASVLVSQCAVDIPKTCRRTATRVTSLLQVASDDLDALAREYGPEFASTVKGWRPGRPPVVWTLPTLHTTSKEQRT
jgi:hypothetical protein